MYTMNLAESLIKPANINLQMNK